MGQPLYVHGRWAVVPSDTQFEVHEVCPRSLNPRSVQFVKITSMRDAIYLADTEHAADLEAISRIHSLYLEEPEPQP